MPGWGAVLKNVSETHGMCLDMGIHIGASENRKKTPPKWIQMALNGCVSRENDDHGILTKP